VRTPSEVDDETRGVGHAVIQFKFQSKYSPDWHGLLHIKTALEVDDIRSPPHPIIQELFQ